MKEQRVITIFEKLIKGEELNLDAKTKELNSDGWDVIQVSNALVQVQNGPQTLDHPVIAITLLCQKK